MGPEGTVYARKALGAVTALSAVVDCTVVCRAGDREPGLVRLLPRQTSHVLAAWPTRRRAVAVVVRTAVTLWTTVGRHEATVVYCPGVLGTLAGVITLVRGRKLAVVVVGDPVESLTEDVVAGPAGQVARRGIAASMRVLCRRASLARYVTRSALQRRFPPGPRTQCFAISDVGPLPFGGPRRAPSYACATALAVASLDQPYKGIAELIEAVAQVRARGYDLRLRVAGEGRLRRSLENLASRRLGDAAQFVGHLSGSDLHEVYDTADLFILPSWTEGLPRALVEAMAAGLPALATDVGGVAELLEPHRLVPPRDVAALVDGIEGLLRNPAAWETSSDHNLRTAAELIAQAATDEPMFVDAMANLTGAA